MREKHNVIHDESSLRLLRVEKRCFLFYTLVYLVDEAARPSLGQHDRPREQVGVAERATGVARLRPDEPCFVQRSRRAEAGKVELKKEKHLRGSARSARLVGSTKRRAGCRGASGLLSQHLLRGWFSSGRHSWTGSFSPRSLMLTARGTAGRTKARFAFGGEGGGALL